MIKGINHYSNCNCNRLACLSLQVYYNHSKFHEQPSPFILNERYKKTLIFKTMLQFSQYASTMIFSGGKYR